MKKKNKISILEICKIKKPLPNYSKTKDNSQILTMKKEPKATLCFICYGYPDAPFGHAKCFTLYNLIYIIARYFKLLK